MNIPFDHRITAQVPRVFSEAVHRAASRRGISIADYTREALQKQMRRDKIDHPRLPVLTPKAK